MRFARVVGGERGFETGVGLLDGCFEVCDCSFGLGHYFGEIYSEFGVEFGVEFGGIGLR